MPIAFAAIFLSLALPLFADAPVRRVVLYKNGVAWVERSGELKAGESVALSFSAEEMNDVLKSLVVESRGAAVARVRYDGAVELTDRLAIEPEAPLAKLLDSFRGARVNLASRGQNVEGRILSARLATSPEKMQRQELNLLLDGGEVRLIDLEGVSSLRLVEARLQKQLDESLLAWSQARAKERKTVTIDAPGATALTARYLVPFPSWKSSYRLSLPETGEATLEGWAIVDNASLEDWQGVNLTVVSGKPVSFISRLYEPKYVARQEADLPDHGAASAVVHEAELRKAVPATAPPSAGVQANIMGQRRVAAAREMMAMDAAAPAPMVAPEVATEAAEAGELFEYKFTEPVNVSRGESVLLPFVRQKLAARRLLVYSGGLHPRAAAELTNNTGKTLDGGPITVYESGGYAGEALMSTTKQGDKRLVSFAEDLGVAVTKNFDTGSQSAAAVTAKRGLLTIRTLVRVGTTYTISNSDAKAKSLLVEHPVTPGQKLASPAATERTPSHYRFAVSLQPNATSKLEVMEERELLNQQSITSWTAEAIEISLRNWKLSPAGQKQLQGILEKKRAIAQTDRELQQAQAEVNDLSRDQQRVRENINTLSRVPNQQEQVQRYAGELAKMDAAIAAAQVRQNELRRQKASLEKELAEMAEKIDF